MIKLTENINDIYEFCLRDTFGTRISALFDAYQGKFDFTEFWYQTTENKITAAISKISGDVTVCASDYADFLEIAEFLSAIGYISITCDLPVAEKLGLNYSAEGWIVEFAGDVVEYNEKIDYNFDLGEIYDLIKSQGVGFLCDKSSWVADVSYRLNHNIARLGLIKDGEKVTSCAMVLFETPDAAFLGAVATDPQYRGKGYSRKIIHSLLALLGSKKTTLFCKKDTIIEFYKKIGFEPIGTFTVTYRSNL